MSNTQTESASATTDPSAVWGSFAPSHPPGTAAAWRPLERDLPSPGVGAALGLMVLSLIISLFAPVCWGYCNGQLRRIDAGELGPNGRSAIEIARGVAVFITVLVAMLIAILLMRQVAR